MPGKFSPSQWRKSPNAPLVFILIGCIASALLTVAAGCFLYRNTQRLLEAGQWVAHTQEVLTNIQTATRFTERIESSTALYAVTKDRDQLDAARLALVRLGTITAHLRSLTADNYSQFPRLQELQLCTTKLNDVLDHDFDPVATTTWGLRCHKALQLMAEEEQQLLEQRNTESRDRSQFSVITEISVAAISLAVLAVLFGLLVRDALGRNRTNRKLAASIKALENQASQARLIGAARQELQLCVNVDQVYRSAALRLSQLLPETSGTLFAMNNSHNILEAMSNWATGGCKLQVADVFAPDSCCGVRGGHLRWRRPGVAELDCDHFQGEVPSAYLCVPLTAHGEILGVLYVQAASESALNLVQARSEGLQQFVQLIGITLAALRLRVRLENQSIRDPLTGLFNRHFMQIAFGRELTRATRRKQSVAVMMLDVDFFKKLNDEAGHAAGDAALKEVAATLMRNLRSEDIICRYGGEEFVALLPEITPESAYHKANALRQAIQDVRIAFEKRVLQVTISIGVSCYSGEGESVEYLLKQADAALYQAKRTGRNRVVTAYEVATLASRAVAD